MWVCWLLLCQSRWTGDEDVGVLALPKRERGGDEEDEKNGVAGSGFGVSSGRKSRERREKMRGEMRGFRGHAHGTWEGWVDYLGFIIFISFFFLGYKRKWTMIFLGRV